MTASISETPFATASERRSYFKGVLAALDAIDSGATPSRYYAETQLTQAERRIDEEAFVEKTVAQGLSTSFIDRLGVKSTR